MALYPLFFLLLFVAGAFLALTRGPIWGLLLYVFVYFNIPSQQWWGGQVPELRWSLLSVAVLLVSCFLHPKQLTRNLWAGNPPLKILSLLLLLMLAVVSVGADPELALGKVYDFFRYVLMFYLVGKVVSNTENYEKFITSITICSFYLFWLAHHYFRGQRLDGVGLPDAADSNMLAALILLVLPLMGALFMTGKTWQKTLVLLATPFALNTFVMCGSRGAFIGLLVQMLVAVILLQNSPYRKQLLAAAVAIAILLFGLMDDKYKSRLSGLHDGIAEGQAAEVSAGRVDLWKSGLTMVSDYPLGAGGGAFMLLSPQYLPQHLIEKQVGQRASHNTYLMVLVEQGILGLCLYLAFIVFLLLEVVQVLRLRSMHSAAANKVVVWQASALLLALTGFWSAAFFIDRVYFEGIYLISALTPALRLLKEPHSVQQAVVVEKAVPV